MIPVRNAMQEFLIKNRETEYLEETRSALDGSITVGQARFLFEHGFSATASSSGERLWKEPMTGAPMPALDAFLLIREAEDGKIYNAIAVKTGSTQHADAYLFFGRNPDYKFDSLVEFGSKITNYTEISVWFDRPSTVWEFLSRSGHKTK